MSLNDAERQELDWALEVLGRGTRPGRLLAYIGEKYSAHREAELTEFTIATEVFGRSAKTFDATQDAVVRVETHRLRKKLRDAYEGPGATRQLHISLPAGTYVPKFLVAPPPPVPSPAPVEAVAAPLPLPSTTGRLPRRSLYLAGAVVVVVAVLAAIGLSGRQESASPRVDAAATPAPGSSSSLPAPAPAAPAGALSEVHVMAGYRGSEVIDASGVRWVPDRYFTGGGVWVKEDGFIRGTSRPFLFANWRSGEFGYDFPMMPGTYEMRLFFISPQHVGDEKIGGFDVYLNGKMLLNAFDANIQAHGADVAEEKVFRDVAPDADGFVRLRFFNQVVTPSVSALELVPGVPGRLKPIRITTQATSFVDHKGQRWRADDYYVNGFRSTQRRKVSGTDDPELFGTERYGHFRYAIPVDSRGRYTVVLHFAELYFGPRLPGGGGEGSRVFNVYCNGQTLLKDFDIFKAGGSLRAVTMTFPNIAPSAQGKINLTFEPVTNNATISGIEILDESR